jgi:hypothetical protein
MIKRYTRLILPLIAVLALATVPGVRAAELCVPLKPEFWGAHCVEQLGEGNGYRSSFVDDFLNRKQPHLPFSPLIGEASGTDDGNSPIYSLLRRDLRSETPDVYTPQS